MAIYFYVDGFEAKSRISKDREDWFAAETFSHGIARPDSGEHVERSYHQEVVLSKEFDECSLELALAADTGRVYSQVIIDITRDNAGSGHSSLGRDWNDSDWLDDVDTSSEPSTATDNAEPPREKVLVRYYLDNAFFSNYMISVGHGSEPVENFAISYRALKWEYPTARERGFLFSSQSAIGAVDTGGSQQGDQNAYASVYDPDTAFLIMQIDPDNSHAEDVCNTVKRAFKEFGVTAVRADDIQHDTKITDVVIDKINTAEFLFADITGERPNVYYEIGYAHSIGKFPMLFRHTGTDIHFDLSVHNVIEYKNMTELEAHIRKRLSANRVGRGSDD